MPSLKFKKTTAQEDLEEREQFVALDVKDGIKFEQRIEIKNGG